jgi:oxygen-independent coproporphyrinogen-3 oxidase
MSAKPAVSSGESVPALSEALLRRFDAPGPRYTSYPTADRFVEAFGADDVCNALAQRSSGAMASAVAPLSVYVHIPFCESVCYYCACNKVITKHHERAAEYLVALDREIGLVIAQLGTGLQVSQLHFGGGSPTYLSDAELEHVVASLRRTFHINDGTEMSIEVDPRTVTPERLAFCRGLGFNRISFGVQDFDPQVQLAVHRVQPFESVRDLMASARTLGFESINADLIYGLPRQTPESFSVSRSMPMPTCRNASNRSAASSPTNCPPRLSAWPCSAGRSAASWAAVTTTSAWTTSPCPTMHWPWPSAKADCTATSRATAPSPIAI